MIDLSKIYWMCDDCGHTELKYAGKCFNNGASNTMKEFRYPKNSKNECAKSSHTINLDFETLSALDDVTEDYLETGLTSGIEESDKVCGGAITQGSFILVGGD